MIRWPFGQATPVTLRRRGDRARDRRHWDVAVSAYRRYLVLCPDDRAISIQLGHALTELGDYAGADNAYASAAALAGPDADLLSCWARSRQLAGDDARAQDLLAAARAIEGGGDAGGEPDRSSISDAVALEPAPGPEQPLMSRAECCGRVESVEGYVVAGTLAASAPGERVNLLLGEQLVGYGFASVPREPGWFAFAATAEVDRHVRLSAVRASDGAELDRSPFNIGPPPERARRTAWAAASEYAKPFAMPVDRVVAVFSTEAINGIVRPHVSAYLSALKDCGIAVLLVVTTDREAHVRPEVLDLVAGALVREARGSHFAAWAQALHLHPELYGASTLLLLNDSLAVTTNQRRFARLIERVMESRSDLVGLTESMEHRWHLHSVFMALKPRLLSSLCLQQYFNGLEAVDGAEAERACYELDFARLVERDGYLVEALFGGNTALDPARYDWQNLVAAGFPFFKLPTSDDEEAGVDGRQDAIRDAGFDTAIIQASLRIGQEWVPTDGAHRLYAHPTTSPANPGRPLRVAFYGPWNYDNGLGVASRNTIAALRRTGVQLNLHPIKKPFHIHRPLGPAVDLIDFNGEADVAVVHLNPDSWFLLTDAQRQAVRRAGKRIGYWVWEMDRLPDAWSCDFASVDRIWAPSQYCGTIFSQMDQAPVDIIPHAVAVPPLAHRERARSLASLGLPPSARVILYIFDGSSYLIRKNPAALVRAFAASALCDRGWTLVLKTKHLMDRPEEGQQFRDLADRTQGAVLIDRTLTTSELTDLWSAADVYASPHCAEGFGLTVAEAMAAGKMVVATDYSGTADLLTPATGYPVEAHPWRLDEDHGHYLSGFSWARIDEAALAQALVQAADAVEAKQLDRADAGRARVAATLSFDSVATRIETSLRRLFTDPGASPRIERLPIDVTNGIDIASADFGPGIVAVPLDPSGAYAPTLDLPGMTDGWIILAPAGTVLAPLLGAILRNHANGRPDVSIFYGDDVAVSTASAIDQLRVKPDFDQTLLAAQDYIGAPVMIRESAFTSLGGLDPKMATAAIGDLLWRAHAAGLSIARIPRVLLAHPAERVSATPTDHRTMLKKRFGRMSEIVEPGLTDDTTLIRQSFSPASAPQVTIIIPTRCTPLPDGSGLYLERALHGIAEVAWPAERLQVIVGDDVVGDPDWARRDWPFALQRVETERSPDAAFNYAAKLNQLWRLSTTEQILFMNDDVRPIGRDWLAALQTFATQPSVGGVGARLLFEDGTLQHAGLAPHGGGAAHVWIHRRQREGTYQDWALTQREWSMVTGAVFATRRSLMEEVNGFDERFSLEFNDTDLCLRLRTLGYRIVYQPAAEMVHAEKASRGDRLPPGQDLALFQSLWKPWLDHDPAWHPQLRLDSIALTPRPESDAWYLRR